MPALREVRTCGPVAEPSIDAAGASDPLVRRSTSSRPRWPSSRAVRDLVLVVGVAVGIRLAISASGQLGGTVAALAGADWPWLPALLVLSGLTHLMGSIALRGACQSPPPLGRTYLVQLAAASSNRLAPAGLGGMATNVRFLERRGTTRPTAVGIVAANSAVGVIVHAVAFAAVMATVQGL